MVICWGNFTSKASLIKSQQLKLAALRIEIVTALMSEKSVHKATNKSRPAKYPDWVKMNKDNQSFPLIEMTSKIIPVPSIVNSKCLNVPRLNGFYNLKQRVTWPANVL